MRDAHSQLVEQNKKELAAVKTDGKAFCEQQLSNTKHAIELMKLGYEEILLNFGELAEGVLNDMKQPASDAGTATGPAGGNTGMDPKSTQGK